MKRRKSCAALLALAMTSGCFAAVEQPLIVAPDLQLGQLDDATAFERTVWLGPEADAAPPADDAGDADAAAPGPQPQPQPPSEPAQAEFETDGPWVPRSDGAERPGYPNETAEQRDKHQRTRKALFWTGVVLGTVGAAGTVGFAVAGYSVRERLDREYEDVTLTRQREQQLTDTGDTMNALAITSGAIGLVGLGMASIAFALDYGACGELARRRRRKDCR